MNKTYRSGPSAWRISPAVFWTAVVVIVLVGAGLGAHRLDEPAWEASHHGYHLAEYPHNALNTLRHGALQTRLGLSMSYGPETPTEELRYRVDHGWVLPLLISWSYRLFGTHAWSARLVPLLFALGLAAWTALLAFKLTGRRWVALLALAVTALVPLTLYYARLPAPHTVATLFCVAAFERYWAWHRSRHPLQLAGLALALLLGVWTDWIVFFVFPALGLHHLLFSPSRRSWGLLVGMAVAPFLLFAGYLLWIGALQGDSAFEVMRTTFLKRTGVSGEGYPSQLTQAVPDFFVLGSRWLTAPVGLLAAGWGAIAARRAWRRELRAEDGLVLCVLLFAVAHNTIFVNRILDHDFIMFWHVLPYVALATPLTIGWLGRWAASRRALFWICAAAACLTFTLQAVDGYLVGHERGIPYVAEVFVGHALNDELGPDESYADAADLDRGQAGLRAHVAADRRVQEITGLPQLRDLDGAGGPDWVVVANSARSDDALRRYLVEHHPRRDVMGFSLFDLRVGGSSVLPGRAALDAGAAQVFGAIEHLGARIDPPVVPRPAPPGLLSSYLDANADLHPERVTTFRVQNQWRKRADDPADYALRTRFVHADGEVVLGYVHDGLDTLYPTSAWPVDRVVVETFDVLVPAGCPAGEYTMRIDVLPAGSGEPPAGGGVAVGLLTLE